jgi:DNA polymerase III delta subunit
VIISISGPDTYRSREKLYSIQELGIQKQAKQEIFDFDEIFLPDTPEILLSRLKQSLNTSSLFTEKRLLIIRGLASLPKVLYTTIKKTLAILKDNPDTIVLFYDTTSILKTHPLTKILDQVGAKNTEYTFLSEQKIITYIHQMSLEQGVDIKRDGIMYIISYQKAQHTLALEKADNRSKSKSSAFQIDLYAIDLLLNQLNNYFGKQSISVEMLKIILPQEQVYSIFSLAESLYLRNYGKYIATLNFLQKQGIEGIKVYGLLLSQIKTALIIKMSQENQKQYTDYVKGHPYILKITAQNIRSWSSLELQSLYENLIRGDYEIKFEGLNPYEKLKSIIMILHKNIEL